MAMEFKNAFDPFRAIRHGFECLKREPAPVLVGGFLMFVLNACQSQGSNNIPSGNNDSPWGEGDDPFGGGSSPFESFDEAMLAAALVVLGVVLCIGVVIFAIKAFIEPGTYRVGERITVDGASGLDTLFSGKDAWLSMVGYRLLMAAIVTGVLAVTALPGGLMLALAVVQAKGSDPNMALIVGGATLITLLVLPALIYVSLGLQFGPYAISIDRLGAMEALDRSWGLAKGNRLRLLWFNLICGLAAFAAGMVGLMMCCVGVLVTVPVATGTIFCAQANAYLLFTREDFEDFALVKEIGAY